MLVVDTSVAVKWVVPESGEGMEANTDAALALLPEALFAPDCITAEFANALFKKVMRSEMTALQAHEASEILPDLVNFVPTVPLAQRALQLALQLPHPVHDCLFLVVAETLQVPLITADAKFWRNCKNAGRGALVQMLGAA